MTNFTNEQLEAWAGLGPWSWSEETICRQIYHVLGPGVLVTTETDGTPWGDTIDQTNAALIAAAPDLARLVLEKDAEIERLRAALKRMLLEFDFMIDANMIADVRHDVIFAEARAALKGWTE